MADKVSIYINKRLIDDIKSFCKLNNKNYLDYITDILEAKLSIDMYGDLNEKIKPKKKPQIKKVEEVKEITPQAIKEEPIVATQTNNVVLVEEEKTKNKRRILNSK